MTSARRVIILVGLVCLARLTEPRCNGECPDGWLKFRDHSCIKISTVRKTWPVAEAVCRTLGSDSHLISIREEADNAAVSALAVPNAATWIGLNDVETEGDWTWVCSGGDQGPDRWIAGSSYGAFAVGEPNDHGDLGEDCVTFEVSSAGASKWNDLNCNQERNFICQKPL